MKSIFWFQKDICKKNSADFFFIYFDFNQQKAFFITFY